MASGKEESKLDSAGDAAGGFDKEDEEPQLSMIDKLKKKILEMSGAEEMGGYELDDLSEKGVAAYLLVLYFCIWCFCLLFLCYQITNSTINTKVLGVELINDADQVCVEVPMVSSGSYMADYWGKWDTNKDFQTNSSIFQLEFKASLLTNSDYKSVMSSYTAQIKALGQKAKTRDVGWNWMAWSTMYFSENTFNTKMSTIGTAQNVYNLAVTAAAVASAKGVCTNTLKGKTKPSKFSNLIRGDFTGSTFMLSYPIQKDAVTGDLLVSGYDHTKFGPCSDQGYVQDVWSWSAAANPDFNYAVEFDAQTTATIIGLNLGLLKKENLQQTSALYDYTFLNIPKGTFYLDARMAPMNPIYCLDDDQIAASTATVTRPDVCFYPYGRKPLLLYPVTAQVGPADSTTGAPTNCQCTTDKTSSHYNDTISTECNKPQVVMGFFYNIDGSANKTNGVIKFALKMQQSVMTYGDYKVGETAFPAMSDSTFLFSSNVKGYTDVPYCPGGKYDSGNGDCIGVCSFDYKTSCLSDSQCSKIQYSVKGDDAYAVASLYQSDDAATCVFVCSTDISSSCPAIATKSTYCPGLPGMGCIQKTYKKSNSKFYNTTKYYETSYQALKVSKSIRANYPFNGLYSADNGGCRCRGYPTKAIAATSGDAGDSSGTDDYAAMANSNDAASGAGNDAASGTTIPADDDTVRVRSRRLASVTKTVGKPVTESDGYTETVSNTFLPDPTKTGITKLYKTWCCPGVTQCECTYLNGTAIYSPSRYSWKCCPDSTKCWCAGSDGKTADGTYKASCCPQKYDTICCDASRSFDNGTSNVALKIDDHFNAICPDRKCAALVFLMDSTVGIFNPLNLYNVDQRQVSINTYQEKTYKFIKATKQWVSTGLKKAKQIMCVDTFFFDDMMTGLSSAPPMPLVQGYYNCHSTLLNAIKTSVGAAAGAASLYTNIAMAAILGAIFTVLNYRTQPDKKLIPRKKKQAMMTRRKERADQALHSLMGMVAEEYIGVKRQVAGTSKDQGIEKMAEKLAFYRKFYPRDGDGEFRMPTDEELIAEQEAARAAALGSESDQEEAALEAEKEALVGKRVGLHGLPPGSPFNGAIGKCMQYDKEGGAVAEEDGAMGTSGLFRVTIIAPNHVRGKRVKVKFENLYKPTPEEVQAAKNAGPPGSDNLLGIVPAPSPQQ